MHASTIIKELAIGTRPAPATMERCSECGGPIYETRLFGGSKVRWVHHFEGPLELAGVENCPAVREFRHAVPAPISPDECDGCAGSDCDCAEVR